MGEEKQGIKELKEAVIAAAKFQKAGKAVLADGKITLGDLPTIVSAAPDLYLSIKAAVQDGKKIPAEIADLSLEEAGELGAAIGAEFGIAEGDKALRIATKALKFIAAGADLAEEF